MLNGGPLSAILRSLSGGETRLRIKAVRCFNWTELTEERSTEWLSSPADYNAERLLEYSVMIFIRGQGVLRRWINMIVSMIFWKGRMRGTSSIRPHQIYWSLPKLWLVEGQSLCVILLHTRFSITIITKLYFWTWKCIFSHNFLALTFIIGSYVLRKN
jgi:hypothetical protein